MFRKLYDWTLRMAGHRHAGRFLGVVAFAESSFFPIPPDVMVIPMVLAKREAAWRIAAIAAIASILGGIAGYCIGYFLWEGVGRPLADFLHISAAVESYREFFQHYGAWVILIQGLTPVPFKLIAISSGLAPVNFALFVLCATITRSARFFLVAGLVKRYGTPIQTFIEKRMMLIGWLFLAAIAGLVAVVALL